MDTAGFFVIVSFAYKLVDEFQQKVLQAFGMDRGRIHYLYVEIQTE